MLASKISDKKRRFLFKRDQVHKDKNKFRTFALLHTLHPWCTLHAPAPQSRNANRNNSRGREAVVLKDSVFFLMPASVFNAIPEERPENW